MLEFFGISVLIGIVVMMITKPSRTSFKQLIRERNKLIRRKACGNVSNILFGKLIDKGLLATTTVETHDCIFVTCGVWESPYHCDTYIGILNTWILVDTENI